MILLNNRIYQNPHIVLVIKMMIYSIKQMKLTGHLKRADVRQNETYMASFHEFDDRLNTILGLRNRSNVQHALNDCKYAGPNSETAVKGNIIADLNQIKKNGIGKPTDPLPVIRVLSNGTVAMLTDDLKEFKAFQAQHITK